MGSPTTSVEPAADAIHRPSRERAQIALAFAGFVFLGIGAGGTGVLLLPQIHDYGVDKATIGLTFIFSCVGYVTAAWASGSLLHRFGVRVCLAGGIAIVFLGAGAVAFRPTFAVFVGVQILLGYGQGAIDAGLNAFCSMLRGATGLLNSLHAFFGVGALLGPLLAAALLQAHLHWTVFYLVFAALALVLVVAVIALYPPAVPAHEGTTTAERPSLWAALRQRAVLLAAAFLAIYVGLEVSLGNWGFAFLTEMRGQSLLLAGWAVAGYWMGLTVGRFTLNRLAARIGIGVAGLTAWCLVGIVVFGILVWLIPSAIVASGGLFVLGFFLGPLFPTMIAAVPHLTPAPLVATAIGILVGLSAAGGALFPWLAGAVYQHLGGGSLLPFSVLLALLLGLVWWRIAKRLGKVSA
jgi:fucose permease